MAALLTPHYDWPLVAVSVAIAIAASYAALDLASSVTVSRGRARLAWLVGGSLAMGMGIWSMHFVGMLAFHLPDVPMAYDVPLLVLSVVVSIFASAVALAAVSRPRMVRGSLPIATFAMGSAIAGMHYIGMASMRMPARIAWDLGLVALSIAIAYFASAVALWLAFRFRRDVSSHGMIRRAQGSVAMGIAISGMHYVAMAAARFEAVGGERPWRVEGDQLLATSGLAVAVILSTLLVLAIALTGSVVDRAFARRIAKTAEAERRAQLENALRTLAHSLVETNEMEKVLRGIAERTLRMSESDGAFIEVIEDDSVAVKAVAGKVAPPPGVRVPYAGSLAEVAVAHGGPRIVANVFDRQWPIRSALPAGCERSCAMLIPLVALRKPVGALIVLRCSDRPAFSDRDLAPAAAVGDLASLGILRVLREGEREKLLRRASELYQQAQDALANRDELLAIVSHDLRNPLAAIDTRAQLLARQAPQDASGEAVRRGAESIRRSALRMAALIDDLGDTASLVQGRLAIEKKCEDPADLLREAAAAFAPLAESKGLELHEETRGTLRPVACDRDRIQQVLSNLVGNALRVTPAPGTITLEASTVDGEVCFAVRDTGPGIPPDDQKRIFERLYRGRTGVYRGAGLGLAISRGIVEAHGGRIWVESEEGKGTAFHFALPLDAAPTSGS